MLRVKLLAETAGTSFVLGQELDLPLNEAKQLIREGRAELIEHEAPRRARARATGQE